MRFLAAALIVALAGCGYVGPPLPPALHIPQPVMDLQAEIVGDKILVRFTPPALTTEELPVELRAITLYIGRGETEFSRERWAASAQRFEVKVSAKDFDVPAAGFAGQPLVLGLRTTGRTGRESDWGKLALLTVLPPLAPPANVRFTNRPDAVVIQWTGNAPRYRVSRVVEGKPQVLAETDVPEYTDRAIVQGTLYEYVIVGIAGDAQQSLPSATAAFKPVDEFPPDVPTGLTAVASGRSVDLSWTRSADADGYNLFRAAGDGAFTLLVQRHPLPAYLDTQVEPGMRYRYAVAAVDDVGNESIRSPEASVQVE
jgi:predicted small lipoprotein YifL